MSDLNTSHIDKQRVAKNSVVLYIRVLVTMLISLWTTRFVLKGLGVEDFGIYNVIAGFVVMFGIVSNSLSASVSRFITFELGKGDIAKLKIVFKSSVLIQYLLAFIILLLTETIGIWFLNVKMNIPDSQIVQANWVFQFSVLSFLIDITNVPNIALMIAYERMKIFAYVGIATAVAKLLISLIIFIPDSNRLIIYSFLLLIVSVIFRIYYEIYSRKHFREVYGAQKQNWGILKEIFAFASWNFIGSISGLCKDQGVNLMLNVFFGPIVNAARGIAMQVSGAATTFAGNFMMALNPQITKSYASEDVAGAVDISFMGARIGYALMMIIGVPIIIYAPILLSLWLGEVPEYSVIFVRLIIVNSIIDVISSTLITLLLATGNIRNYQIVVGTCTLLNLPVSYLILKLGFSPQSVIIVSIFISIITLLLRLFFIKKQIKISILYFVKNVLSRLIAMSIFAISPLYFLFKYIGDYSISKSLIGIVICILWTTCIAYFIILNIPERKQINSKVRNLIDRRLSRSGVSDV